MNEVEFATFTMALKTYYPKENLLPTKEAMQLWYEQLKDIDYKIAETGLNKWVTTNKWSPTIADIRQMANDVTGVEVKDWGAAFEEARHAIRIYGYMREEEALESMSPLTRQVVKRLNYQDMCKCEDIEVERGQFRMIYENLSEREKEDALIPQKLKDLIAQTQQQMIEG